MTPIDAQRFAAERRKFDPSLCDQNGAKLDKVLITLESLDDFIRAKKDFTDMRKKYLNDLAVKEHNDAQAAKVTRRMSCLAMFVAIVGGILGWFSGRA